jgi:hypothetical protein
MNDLLRRQKATAATLAKYRGQAFDWKKGITCVHMARFHLRQMGHKPAELPRMRGAIGARRALDERGWAGVADMLDAQQGLMRIAPAMMLLGDIAVLPADQGFDAIVVCEGGHKMLGWHEEWAGGMVEMEASLAHVLGAWRV